MEYAALVDVYERLEATDSTLGKRDVLATAFVDAGELLGAVVSLVQGRPFPAWRSADLGVSSRLTTRAIVKATGVETAAIEERWEATGDLGDGAAWAVEHAPQQSLVTESLTVERVHGTLRELAAYEGERSQGRRTGAIAGLLSDASSREARYVTRTALGHLRIGVAEGLVRDAIATAFLVEREDGNGVSEDGIDHETARTAVERAFQVTNDYPLVAHSAREEGLAGLTGLDVSLFRPIGVMLARKAEGIEAGIGSVAKRPADVIAEYKYDGIRVQIHKQDDQVSVFTRRLEDVTEAFPDLVRAIRDGIDAGECVLDGEAVGHDPETGEPLSFQRFSRRIKREHDVERLAERIPATAYVFDLLACDGRTLFDESLATRRDALDDVFDPRSETLRRADCYAGGSVDEIRAFYREALEAGHEGIMLKNCEAPYRPGRRVGHMMKVKPTMDPLDLVVTRAQYSEGRRSDYLGRLFLSCLDDRATTGDHSPETDPEFREVGRLATGYTDAELEALTERLEGLLAGRNGRVFEVDPAVVLEIEYEEIQDSSEYDSGYALRFPRFVGVREDLGPADADPLSRVKRLYDEQ